jgi:hypothetical protein
VPEVCLPLELSEAEALRQLSRQVGQQLDVQRVTLIYEPAILGAASIRFDRRNISEQQEKYCWHQLPASGGGLGCRGSESASRSRALDHRPAPLAARFGPSEASATQIKGIASRLADWLYYRRLDIITIELESSSGRRAGARHQVRLAGGTGAARCRVDQLLKYERIRG